MQFSFRFYREILIKNNLMKFFKSNLKDNKVYFDKSKIPTILRCKRQKWTIIRVNNWKILTYFWFNWCTNSWITFIQWFN